MPKKFRSVVLIILDGFGIAPPDNGNAISLAKKPFFNSLITNYPTVLLEASGLSVGLPRNEVGNSEVGHLTIGSGILRYQNLPRIDRSISTGKFFKINDLENAFKKVKKTKCKLHLVGLLGNGGVHSSQEHLEALITMAKKNKIWKRTFIHGFLDGRDTAKDDGLKLVKKLVDFADGDENIASLSGRFYGMDRNRNWDRTAKAYEAIINGKAQNEERNPLKTIQKSYDKKIYDEEFEPTIFTTRFGKPKAVIEDSDVVIFFNFRSDRARQLTESLTQPDFDKFPTKKLKDLETITFTEYEKGLPSKVLFPTEIIQNPLAKIFSDYNLKQLHIAETEKYAHVTFFLNGRQEEKFSGEDRLLIPSPNVSTYDESPDMSAKEVTDNILKALKQDTYDFMVVNYANPDMVGHTGNLKAAIQAIETTDQCLSKVVKEVVKKGGIAFVVADHGNAEVMINPSTGQEDKEHNPYPVPFIMVSNSSAGQTNKDIFKNDLSTLNPVGILADIAPTILKNINLTPPPEMTGTNLF